VYKQYERAYDPPMQALRDEARGRSLWTSVKTLFNSLSPLRLDTRFNSAGIGPCVRTNQHMESIAAIALPIWSWNWHQKRMFSNAADTVPAPRSRLLGRRSVWTTPPFSCWARGFPNLMEKDS
jgi:hypothetical protein